MRARGDCWSCPPVEPGDECERTADAGVAVELYGGLPSKELQQAGQTRRSGVGERVSCSEAGLRSQYFPVKI